MAAATGGHASTSSVSVRHRAAEALIDVSVEQRADMQGDQVSAAPASTEAGVKRLREHPQCGPHYEP